MIAAWIYGGPVAAQRAVVATSNLLLEAFNKYSAGIITEEEYIERLTEVQNYLESKRSLFGKFGDYSNKLFTTPIKDLKGSIWASTNILIGGIVGLAAELVSLYMEKQHMSIQWQALASGISLGASAYTIYVSMKNIIKLPGNFGLMNSIGTGASIISIFASGWQIGELLKDN